jgi:hypothetical protein
MNNTTINETSGELTTLYKKLYGHKGSFDKILIPKIQRDYAQGRKGKEKLRERFLNRLFDAIDKPNALPIELDFIYGQLDDDVFYPIDGQQRLTTLFLLHLYLAKRTGCESTDALRKFSYETRDSSKQFCEKLHEIDGADFIGIKTYIENKYWFTKRWKNDPTIKSMIVMLAAIDTHYSDYSNEDLCDIWNRLKSNIQFWLLTLDDLKATDDLYIKMNSRGKQLTDFEHFKAEIESYVHSSTSGQFSLKVDTTWTNLLWEYRNKENDFDDHHENYGNNGLDRMFLNIFKRYMLIEGVKSGEPLDKLEKYDALELAAVVLKEKPLLVDRFTKIMDFFSDMKSKSVDDFFNSILTNDCDDYTKTLNTIQDYDSYRVYIAQDADNAHVNYLKTISKANRFTMTNMLFVEAFFEYAAHKDELPGGYELKDRVRIVRNLVINSRDEIRREKMCGLLRNVDAVISSDNLVESLKDLTEFRDLQVAQEVVKLKWIESHPDDLLTIFNVENHSVLVGNIAMYIEDETCYVDRLVCHSKLFCFDENHDRYDRIECLLLTVKDYAPSVHGRKLYGGRKWTNWRDDIFINKNDGTAEALKKLYGKLTSYTDSDIDEYIQTWVENQESACEFTWTYYMVKHKGMRHGEDARYAPNSLWKSYNYFMMNKTNFNGKHWIPYLFCLHTKFPKSNLGEYGDPLVFAEENMTITAYEDSFIVTFLDGSKSILSIPQKNGVDSVDRIVFAEEEIKRILQDKTLKGGAVTSTNQ